MTAASTPSSSTSEISKRLSVKITFLEQRARPADATPAPAIGKIAILRAERSPLHFYRYLYRLVGDPWNWVSRRRLDDVDLAEIIHDPEVYILVLYLDGAPAGFAEIDNRLAAFAEIRFFGIAPDAIGRRLGRYFLSQVLHMAWDLQPRKIRLETCTLDHPAALPLYQKLGFEVVDRRDGVVDLID
ncbi:MAG: GNAT family N-acetyltransferase [Pseudomonadota bacterium]